MAKTASELSREELRSYRPWLSMERHRKDSEITRRREDAWRVARVAAEMLKKRFGVTRNSFHPVVGHRPCCLGNCS
jgi:hypothetical protein